MEVEKGERKEHREHSEGIEGIRSPNTALYLVSSTVTLSNLRIPAAAIPQSHAGRFEGCDRSFIGSLGFPSLSLA